MTLADRAVDAAKRLTVFQAEPSDVPKKSRRVTRVGFCGTACGRVGSGRVVPDQEARVARQRRARPRPASAAPTSASDAGSGIKTVAFAVVVSLNVSV